MISSASRSVLFALMVCGAQGLTLRHKQAPAKESKKQCDSHYDCGGAACLKGQCQAPATAKIYLMNLAHRKDRCQCAKEQFAKASPGAHGPGVPYQVVRVLAETPDTYPKTCNDIRLPSHTSGNRDVKPGVESALMCTNWKIWRAAWEEYQQGKGSDYTILMEDDVIIDQEKFFPRLMEFLNGPCKEWDHVRVDTFWNGDDSPAGFYDPDGSGELRTCYRAHPNNKFEEELRKEQGMGNHFLILKTASIGKMLQQAWDSQGDDTDYSFVADHFHYLLAPRGDFHLKTWQPKILSQMGHQEGESKTAQSLPKDCAWSVADSDLQGRSGKVENDYAPDKHWDGLPKWGNHTWDHKGEAPSSEPFVNFASCW